VPKSDKYKCIFVHIPKTAGSSIEKSLDMLNKDLNIDDQEKFLGKYRKQY